MSIWIPAFAGMTTVGTAQGLDRLHNDLDSLFHDTKFANATFGVCVQSLKTGEYLYRLNDTKSLLPASNMKLFTAAEALAMLGPGFKFHTEYLTNGKQHGKTIFGDLILRGVGDPTLLPQLGDAQLGLQELANSINRITGSIRIDNSYFTTEQYPIGWQIDDLGYYYAPPISATISDENQVVLEVQGGHSVGISPSVDIAEDHLPYGVIENLAVTGPDSSIETIDAVRKNGTDTIVVTGSIPKRQEKSLQVSIEHPDRRAAQYVLAYLDEMQINVSEKARTKKNSMLSLLSIEVSDSLSKLIEEMNKESDNLYAECLFRTVAKEKGGEGSWTRGIEVMRKYLASIGIDTMPLQFTDGSGLSRMDYVTSNAIVKLLAAMWNDPKLKEPFYNSLPIAGVDGTFKNHLKATPAEGNARGKSGSMTGVRALSGYLTTKDGEPLAYSIIANNYTAQGSEAGKLEDSVVLRLVNFSRK